MIHLFSSNLRLSLAAIVLLSLFPVLALTIETGLEQRQMEAEAIKTRALDIARHAADDESDLIQASQQLLQGLAVSSELSQGGPACVKVLGNLVNLNPQYAFLAMLDLSGIQSCGSSLSLELRNLGEQPWFRRAMERRETVISDVQIDQRTGKAILYLVHPVLDEVGRPVVMLVAGLDLSASAHLPALSALPPNTVLHVLDGKGSIVVTYPASDRMIMATFLLTPTLKDVMARQSEGTAEIEDADGLKRLYAFTPLSDALGSGAYLGLGIPVEAAYDQANWTMVRNLALIFVITILALMAARWGADSLVLRPVNTLLAATRRVASGDLEVRRPIRKTGGELGMLAEAFDRMAEALNGREKELKQTAEAWRQSELKFRSFVESSQDGIVLTDEQGAIIEWNAGQEDITGLTRSEVQGKPIWDVQFGLALEERKTPATHGQIRELVLRLLSSADWSNQGNLHEIQFRRADGNIRVMQTQISRVKTERGFLLGSVSRDITGRRQADQEVRDSESRYRQLVELSPDAIAVHSEGKIVFLNPAGAGLFGADDPSQVIGKPMLSFVHPDYRESVVRRANQVIEEGTAAPLIEEKLLRLDGTAFDVEVASMPIDYHGRPAAQVVIREITERKKAEKQIQRQLERISALRTIDAAISSSLNLRVSLGVLLDQVTSHLDVDAASVLLFNQTTHALDCAAARGFRSVGVIGSNLSLSESLAGRAVMERRTVHAHEPPESYSASLRGRLLAGEQFVAYYATPLTAKGRVVGVLEVFHRAPLIPDDTWFEFLEALAGQAAIAIDNASLFDELQRTNTELMLSYDVTLEGWVRALDLRHNETEGHTRRVTDMASRLARVFGLSEAELVHVRRGSLLHDIGKMAVPDGTLLKPGSLNEEEWAIMRRHPEYAYQFLSSVSFLRPALDIPYCHHEKWDGTGYPRGIKGEDIPLTARIFAVVDAWDALRSDRIYRSAWPEEQVRRYLRERSGIDFDPAVVEAFLSLLESNVENTE